MNSFLQDARYGLRQLLKQPAFTGLAVLMLALGIGATTAIFSVVNAVLLHPLPYPQADRLVALSLNDGQGELGNTGYATFVDWQARNQSFEQLALIRPWNGTLTGQGEPENIQGLRVTPNYFKLLGVTPALGREFRAEEDRPDSRFVVVLSHALWQRRFNADPQAIGKQIVLSGQTFTVIGVMPPDFEDVLANNFYRKAEAWAVLGYDIAQPWACRSCQHLKAFGRLKAGVSLSQAQIEMNGLAAALKQEHPKEYPVGTAVVFGLQDQLIKSIRPALYLLLIAVAVVLLIACVNVANLLLARAADRAREMAVRAALGADRFRIIRQLLVESILLAGLGAVVGVLLAVWGVELLMALKPATILKSQVVTVEGRVLGFAVMLALLTGILFGLVPAWHAAKTDLQLTLKAGERSLNAGSRARSLLVVVEIALALVLLIGAGLLSKSFIRLLNVTPGFEASNLVTMYVPAAGTKYDQEGAVRQFYRTVLERVSVLPGVEAAGIVSNLPLSGNGDRSGFHIEEKPLPNPAKAPSIERFGVSPDYFRTMRISLLRGRGFTAQDDEQAPLVVMISQTAAQRFWPHEDPLGKRVRLGGPDGRLRTIVGIVPDVLHHGLDAEPDIQAYVPHAQWADSLMQLTVRTSVEPTNIVNAIRQEVHAVDKDIPIYQVATMKELMAATTAQRRFTLSLVGVFAGISLVLAALGIYSVMAYFVAQRTHEIGLRMALGAQRGDVWRLIIAQGMKLALSGLALGILASVGLTRLMTSLLFGITPTDPLTFGLVTFLLLTVMLLACWVPARRATKLDPLNALRYE